MIRTDFTKMTILVTMTFINVLKQGDLESEQKSKTLETSPETDPPGSMVSDGRSNSLAPCSQLTSMFWH